MGDMVQPPQSVAVAMSMSSNRTAVDRDGRVYALGGCHALEPHTTHVDVGAVGGQQRHGQPLQVTT